jgi:hypothetical protein
MARLTDYRLCEIRRGLPEPYPSPPGEGGLGGVGDGCGALVVDTSADPAGSGGLCGFAA